jgi:hypothetical protein
LILGAAELAKFKVYFQNCSFKGSVMLHLGLVNCPRNMVSNLRGFGKLNG